MFIVARNKKIVLADTEYKRIADTVRFIPELEGLEIKEVSDNEIEKGYDGAWYFAGQAPEKPAASTEQIIRQYEDAVQSYLDQTAQSRDYDNTYTCLSYLSSTDEVWNREAHAFNAWRDQVWRKCHEILNAAMGGEIPVPTVEELIAMLPAIDWNDPKEEA